MKMAALKEVDVPGVGYFNPHGDPAQIAQSWTRWLRSFELFAEGKGVKNPNQKRALLLHCTGQEVQDIFFAIPDGDEESTQDAYEKAKGKLNSYFQTKLNIPYERYLFKCLNQKEGETTEQFVTRLRQRAATCAFQNADESIRDQVIEKCRSPKIRARLLEKGDDLTLDQLRTIAATIELTESQTRQMNAGPPIVITAWRYPCAL